MKNYRTRKNIRLKDYDYSKEGIYFITICSDKKECIFGKISEGNMELNIIGKIVKMCWEEIPDHFPNIELHDYVIMPNHIHGIIEIRWSFTENDNLPPQSGTSGTIGSVGYQRI